jgi:hypothetical protein
MLILFSSVERVAKEPESNSGFFVVPKVLPDKNPSSSPPT